MITPEELYRLGCTTLGLIHPADRDGYRDHLLHLGTFAILDSDQALDACTNQYLTSLKSMAQSITNDRADEQQQLSAAGWLEAQVQEWREHYEIQEQEIDERAFLPFQDFIKFHGREDAERNRDTPIFGSMGGAAYIREIARWRFAHIQRSHTLSRDRAGYRRYLRLANQRLCDALSTQIDALVPEEPRRTHSYIVSTTKTGKSELLKALTLSYVQAPDYSSVMILDPGGDMCQEIARWPELIPQGRLIYIEPTLSPHHTPTFNPLDADGMNEEERAIHAGQVRAAIETLMDGKLGGSFSINMEAILDPSIQLLVDTPGASLKHLIDLMLGDETWVERGCRSPREEVRDFFQNEFNQLTNLASSKEAIAVKIRKIVNDLGDLARGKSTVDLEKALASRKVVLVNLAAGLLKPASAKAFGTLLVATVQSIGMRRARIQPPSARPMTHLIIDECQNFISPEVKTIIREQRKLGFALTLAQQEVGGDMPPDIRKVVVSTTDVKVAGRSHRLQTKETAELVGVSAEEIASLPNGQFYYCNGGRMPAFKLHVRSDRVGLRNGSTDDLWKQIRAQQLRFFYRKKVAGVTAGITTPSPAQTPKKEEVGAATETAPEVATVSAPEPRVKPAPPTPPKPKAPPKRKADLTQGKPSPRVRKRYDFE